MSAIKKTLSLLAAVLLLTAFSCSKNSEIKVNQVRMNWRYDAPAKKFWEGLPIGTGRFGAMIPGAIAHEVVAFNDETLWTGGPYNSANSEAPETVKRVRELSFAKRWKEADDEARKLFGNPMHVQFYQPMGRLNIEMKGHADEAATGYFRSLSMDSAIVDIGYTIDGVQYSRRVFASFPEQTVVYRLSANKKGKISFSTYLTSLQPSAVAKAEGNEITMEGSTISEKKNELILPPAMRWQSRLRVVPEGGKTSVEGDRIVVENADAVTLILAGATNWVAWNDVSADEKQRCKDYIEKAAAFSYKTLLKRHLDDYCPLFAACKINVGKDEHPERTTSATMDSIRAGENDHAYEARYFQYGRYLLLAAARENTLAFNNHNMWLNDLDGRWRGRWTLNINIQECYWCAENTNLPTVNESLLLFAENLAASGTRTAKEHWGCRGWCTGHGTDVWFMTTPTDGQTYWGLWQWGGHWIMQQLFDHYVYNPSDTAYLKRIYPLLKGAAEYCLDYLVKEPESGYYVTCPSTSPENSFIDETTGRGVGNSFASAGDVQIVRRSLKDFIAASEILGNTDEVEQAREMLAGLPPHKIGQHGQLQEWFYDFPEAEPTHRHTMHLWAFYPDDDITLRDTPALADAVKTVLQRRGNINMGWSGAWKINIHARLEEPEKCYEILHKMLTDVSIHPSPEDSRITPSFEGNQAIQGVTAGMAEMLMQSYVTDSITSSDTISKVTTISLLPALPKEWSSGSISGLRAKGGYSVDIEWKNGTLTKAVITASRDGILRVRTKTPVKDDGLFHSLHSKDESVIELNAVSGRKYYFHSTDPYPGF